MNDLELVEALFVQAKQNFEHDGYLVPILFAWSEGKINVIATIEGNPRDVVPLQVGALRLLGYEKVALLVEGWIGLGEEACKDFEKWTGRQEENPQAMTSIQLIFVSKDKIHTRFAVYDKTEAGWVLVEEFSLPDEWHVGGELVDAMRERG